MSKAWTIGLMLVMVMVQGVVGEGAGSSEPDEGGPLDKIMNLVEEAGACVSSSIPLVSDYMDVMYPRVSPILVDFDNGLTVAYRTVPPDASHVLGYIIVARVGTPCSDFFHEGDEGGPLKGLL